MHRAQGRLSPSPKLRRKRGQCDTLALWSDAIQASVMRGDSSWPNVFSGRTKTGSEGSQCSKRRLEKTTRRWHSFHSSHLWRGGLPLCVCGQAGGFYAWGLESARRRPSRPVCTESIANEDMEMLDAIYAGDEGEVAKLLDEDPLLLEEKGYAGNPSLVVAARYGKLGVMRLLAQRGAKVDAKGVWGRTALHWAAEGGYEEVVAFLISQGVHVDIYDCHGKTSLLLACGGGHVGVIQKLVQHIGGRTTQARLGAATTALRWALREGHEQMANLALGKGAQVGRVRFKGRTALMEVSWRGRLGLVQMLVQHMGAGELEERDEEGRTALHHAAFEGHGKIVDFLLSRGAQAYSRDRKGRTALIEASENGHLGLVQTLVQRMGAECFESRQVQGETALYCAARRGHEEIVAFLLSKTRQATRQGALMQAAMGGHLGVVRVLMRRMGKQVLGTRNGNGRTALHMAASCDQEEMVRFLLVAGANPSTRDNMGWTPRAIAENKHAGCVAAFQWWKGQLERRPVLYRARYLHKAYTMQQHQPSFQVPTYLEARSAVGHVLPSVEVVSPESDEQQAGASGKRKAGEKSDQEDAEAGRGEVHAVVEYVVKALNEELFTELLEGFHEPMRRGENEE